MVFALLNGKSMNASDILGSSIQVLRTLKGSTESDISAVNQSIQKMECAKSKYNKRGTA